MTKSSSKDKAVDTITCRLDELLKDLAGTVVQMKESLDTASYVPRDQVNEAHTIMGELTWLTGAVEAAVILMSVTEGEDKAVH